MLLKSKLSDITDVGKILVALWFLLISYIMVKIGGLKIYVNKTLGSLIK